DGIRGFHVTGVQTCALPIYSDCPASCPRPAPCGSDIRAGAIGGAGLASRSVENDRRRDEYRAQHRRNRAGRRRIAGPHPENLSPARRGARSEEHTSELQSRENLVCRLLLEKK